MLGKNCIRGTLREKIPSLLDLLCSRASLQDLDFKY